MTTQQTGPAQPADVAAELGVAISGDPFGPESRALLDALDGAAEQHGGDVLSYFLGALPVLLVELPGGVQAWGEAVRCAVELADAVELRRGRHAADDLGRAS